jgi:geranylgeranyl transferase type-2 subunit alpha
VVEQAQVSAREEFDFTSNKIKENFSNYSSWHYRSKLLPKIHPACPGDTERVEEEALLKGTQSVSERGLMNAYSARSIIFFLEFQLVQNAFFTDPNDQSAWFYHRWLLGRGNSHNLNSYYPQ